MEDLMTFSNNKSWPWSFVVTKIQKQMPMKKRFVVSWYRNKKKIHLKESVSSCYLCVKCSSSFWVKLATSTPCFTVVLFLCFQCGFLDKNTATCLWQELHDRLLQQQWIFCVFSSETLRLSGLLRLSDSWMWRGHEWVFFFLLWAHIHQTSVILALGGMLSCVCLLPDWIYELGSITSTRLSLYGPHFNSRFAIYLIPHGATVYIFWHYCN